MGKKRRRKRQRQLDMAVAAIRLRYGPPGLGQGETGGDGRQRGLLWELGGLIYQEEGLDIEVPLEPVTLPALGRAERLDGRWNSWG